MHLRMPLSLYGSAETVGCRLLSRGGRESLGQESEKFVVSIFQHAQIRSDPVHVDGTPIFTTGMTSLVSLSMLFKTWLTFWRHS